MPDIGNPLLRNKRRRHTSPHEDEQTANDISDPAKRHQHVDTRQQDTRTPASQSIPLQLPLPTDTPQILEAKLTTTTLDPEPTSARPLKNAKRRAEALNRLYTTDQARPGHVVWFTRHHVYLLPLVKAVARVIGAERDICGGDKGAAMAELQTVNAVLGVLGEVISNGKGGVDDNLIARVQAVLAYDASKKIEVAAKASQGRFFEALEKSCLQVEHP
ncbi:MAG: hypothetical protein Q9182_005740 [Xanthomendoza sp. 2 TL-2023]